MGIIFSSHPAMDYLAQLASEVTEGRRLAQHNLFRKGRYVWCWHVPGRVW